MPTIETILLFMAAGLALNFTPGPDMLYVAARSTSEGRSAGLASVLGITVGCCFHIAAMALGLSAVLLRVPAAYDAIRIAGAAYLVYLGARALLRPHGAAFGAAPRAAPLSRVFLQGVATNVLNPKVALFFLAFVPQFIDPTRGPVGPQVVLLGSIFNTTGFLVNAGVALLASRSTSWLRERPGAGRSLQRVTGAVFLGLGVRLALAKRS